MKQKRGRSNNREKENNEKEDEINTKGKKKRRVSESQSVSNNEPLVTQFTIQHPSQAGVRLRGVEPYFYDLKTFCKQRWFGRTIEDVLRSEFPLRVEQNLLGVDRNRIQVNYKPVTRDYIFKNGDLVLHTIHQHEPLVIDEEPAILFDSNDFFVVNKASSYPCHPCGRYNHNSMIQMLREGSRTQQQLNKQTFHLINRLDSAVSGCVLVGKNQHFAQAMRQRMNERSVQKSYVARVWGDFRESHIGCPVVNDFLYGTQYPYYILNDINSHNSGIHIDDEQDNENNNNIQIEETNENYQDNNSLLNEMAKLNLPTISVHGHPYEKENEFCFECQHMPENCSYEVNDRVICLHALSYEVKKELRNNDVTNKQNKQKEVGNEIGLGNGKEMVIDSEQQQIQKDIEEKIQQNDERINQIANDNIKPISKSQQRKNEAKFSRKVRKNKGKDHSSQDLSFKVTSQAPRWAVNDFGGWDLIEGRIKYLTDNYLQKSE
ncbi:MAG: putative pseudouridine synthase [Streblomastix strix]|uniref:Putative pseudouridine synthase n=1 Tax=Streblomastix strix TaxID=222440 RepID=A0A5J4WU77_9EUKA|nr:MAG: putative pseudouridine synthase [Streblomastix strix]